MKMPRPTVLYERKMKENGHLGPITKTYSYVVTLCEIGGSEVRAIRVDGAERKADVSALTKKMYPDWKVKTVNRLYDEDFENDRGTEESGV